MAALLLADENGPLTDASGNLLWADDPAACACCGPPDFETCGDCLDALTGIDLIFSSGETIQCDYDESDPCEPAGPPFQREFYYNAINGTYSLPGFGLDTPFWAPCQGAENRYLFYRNIADIEVAYKHDYYLFSPGGSCPGDACLTTRLYLTELAVWGWCSGSNLRFCLYGGLEFRQDCDSSVVTAPGFQGRFQGGSLAVAWEDFCNGGISATGNAEMPIQRCGTLDWTASLLSVEIQPVF